MITDMLAVAGLVALVLLWLAAQRIGARHGAVETATFRCGACRSDCGGSRPDCPLNRLEARNGVSGDQVREGTGRDDPGESR